MSDFFEKLVEKLNSDYNVPRFQHERVLSPILGFYLEGIIEKYLSKKYELITVEFPILKRMIETKEEAEKAVEAAEEEGEDEEEENELYICIDYLLVNKENETALLVELKTDCPKKKDKFFTQADNYKKILKKIEEGEKLINFVPKDFKKKITKSISKKRERYNNQREKILGLGKIKIKEIEIMYIAPKSVIDLIKDKDFIKHKITFGYLLETDFHFDSDLDADWNMIKDYIGKLNEWEKKDDPPKDSSIP
jgi:hypothetical protein